MIDFHSHILPVMDDGSKNTQESIAMLNSLKAQGVKRVVVTPHFYANDDSVSSFLERRQKSFEKLKAEFAEASPEIVLGAEVRYYDGISKLENLSDLCIQGTRMLLIEMPGARWTEYVLSELFNLAAYSGHTVVLAHIERYMNYQSADVFEKLLANDVLMQVNADFVTGFFSKHKALNLFRKEKLHFIGSDCHNLTTRPPEIAKAYELIGKKLGTQFLNDLIEYENEMFLL
ncbi:MAG: capsular polysaccharide biosynthesis protein [Clostridia bacterium]|nr:capsular polysaccharide biosynthesis protein [Clostridia bacterium]MBQ3129063.1 capsular polysaccharide biosynthesis protein [Clostridia bacterium]